MISASAARIRLYKPLTGFVAELLVTGLQCLQPFLTLEISGANAC